MALPHVEDQAVNARLVGVPYEHSDTGEWIGSLGRALGGQGVEECMKCFLLALGVGLIVRQMPAIDDDEVVIVDREPIEHFLDSGREVDADLHAAPGESTGLSDLDPRKALDRLAEIDVVVPDR